MKITKTDISLKELVDIDTTNGSRIREDNIRHNQILMAHIINDGRYQPKIFRFKNLSDIVTAGTGITITEVNGALTISASGGSGDMLKSTYDTDNDGVVDQAECVKIIVRNSTGATLTKGQVVYLLGATGNRPNAVLADASTEATSSKTIGLVSADIANNADGYVTVSGTMHDLALNMFADGDRLWLDSTPGGMVATTPPAEPNHSVFIGTVARAHPTQGRIILAIQNGYELNELHGVQVSSEANNDIIYYQGSTGLWKNKQMPVVNIISTTDGTTVTGTTANTYTDSVLIPANSVAVGDVIAFRNRVRKTGTAGLLSVRAYVNTSAVIGGANVAISSNANTSRYSQMVRQLVVKSSTNTEGFPIGGVFTDDAQTGTVVVNSSIDWTVDQYLVISVQNTSAADSTISSFIHVQVNKT